MTRLGERRAAPEHSFDTEIPTMGCYRVRLRRGAPDSAVRIWLGYSIGPDGEEMTERGMYWQCTLNGQRVPIETCWPGCGREQISREQHDEIVERNRTMDETSPFYDPRRSVDIRTAPPPSF